MATTPEKEPLPKVPEGITERPESLPEKLEKEQHLKVRPTQFTAQVTDDQGQPIIQTPKTKVVTVQLPADQVQLDDWAKGSPIDALTWFAVYWLRMIKKALHFGWKTIAESARIRKPNN